MGGRRWDIDGVRAFFAERGCTLLTEDYTGCDQRLIFRCSCGRNEIETCFRQYKYANGTRCSECTNEVRREASKKAMRDPEILAKRVATFQRNYGTDSPLQNVSVKERRAATCLKRYGVSSVSQDPEINQRQREGFKAKYGVNHFMANPESLSKFRQTMLDRYGAPSLAFVSRRSSKESQDFFTSLASQIPDGLGNSYFSPKTSEFNVWYESRYYKYDFVHTGLKKAIEYNGSRFHPKPGQTDDEVGWCLFRPKRTVREAREYEQHKLDALRNRGFDVLVVWDHEVKHDSNSVIGQCLAFLLN